jgi:hypothetical protein
MTVSSGIRGDPERELILSSLGVDSCWECLADVLLIYNVLYKSSLSEQTKGFWVKNFFGKYRITLGFYNDTSIIRLYPELLHFLYRTFLAGKYAKF